MSKKRCAYCRDYFESDQMVVRGLSAYCSNEHYLSSVNKAKTKQKIVKKLNDDLDITEAQRLTVLDLDGYRCRYCGKASANLAVHHIAYRSEAKHEPWLNDPVNLISLCNYPCHLDIIHGNKKLYQPLCRQIVYLRALRSDKTTTIQQLEREHNDTSL